MALLLTPKLDFIAFDFETANSDVGSICQIGVALVQNGNVSRVFSELVNPLAEFDGMNISVHGITPNDVANAPTFDRAMQKFAPIFSKNIAVSHSAFDKNAITKACDYSSIACPLGEWIDSMRVVRRAWPDKFGKSGYGLRNVADSFGIEFGHHDAGEDARAAALIMLKAIEDTGKDAKTWLKASYARTPRQYAQKKIAVEGNPHGDLNGHIAVFTGELKLNRREAAELAATVGITVTAGVTKKTTMLVVGTQDLSLLAGHQKSSKHRKAETYISNGQNIRVLTETDFLKLVALK